MEKTNSQSKPAGVGHRFSGQQYEMLRRCSDNKDMTEWNEWRKNNPGQDVLLGGAELGGAWLEGADMRGVDLSGADIKGAYLGNVDLSWANLQGADGGHTDLRGAKLVHAKVQGARFTGAIVDGATAIWNCQIDRGTNFTGAALLNASVDPESKQLLEYNERRMRWKRWYKWEDWDQDCPEGQRNKASQGARQFVRLFWGISDYGRSTKRIIYAFFLLAIFFALVYWQWPSCVVVSGQVGGLNGMVHSFYFSVVTMTTLGFGDIHANPASSAGQILLMVQVLLGYVLLAALVTRFAVLFQAGGPGGQFKEMGQ